MGVSFMGDLGISESLSDFGRSSRCFRIYDEFLYIQIHSIPPGFILSIDIFIVH